MPRPRNALTLDRSKFYALVHHPQPAPQPQPQARGQQQHAPNHAHQQQQQPKQQKETIQYWLTIRGVLAGLPGPDHVPRGHWPRLVDLAREIDARGREGDEALVTAWCAVEEPVGEVDQTYHERDFELR